MSGTCDGTGDADAITCTACKDSCGAGNFMSGTCDGTGDADAITCTACKTSCDEGFVMSGTCDGTGNADAITCTEQNSIQKSLRGNDDKLFPDPSPVRKVDMVVTITADAVP